MTIVTGDRYLDLLSKFIESNTGPLLDGSVLLKLNPVGLHYLQTRLEALHELEALRVGAPVDYLRAYVADLGDHRALEQLRRVLSLLTSVKVATLTPGRSRDPTTVTLLPFSRLRSLELRGCDLSTSAARGLLELRPILEKLVCYNSADALRHIFAERTIEVQDAQRWSRLIDVSCFGNGMLLMDESLQLLPVVEVLDLSRNRFAKLANLQRCPKLRILDAGFNHITSLGSVHQNLRCIRKLILKNNALVSTRGLHRLAYLEALDLSYNLLSNFREVELLSELPSLNLLWLEGNPLTFGRSYREEALSFFGDPMKLILDGRQITRSERYAASSISARRLKQRSKYGAFTPAEAVESCLSSHDLGDSGDVEDNSCKGDVMTSGELASSSSVLRARKKSSRLASIQDVTIGLKMASRALELQRNGSFSMPASPDANPPLQVVVESKEEMKETVLDLMKQAEDLKRGGSDCWLKDLNILLEKEAKDKSPEKEGKENSVLSGLVRRSSSNSAVQSQLWQKRRRKRIGSSSNVLVSVSRDSEASSSESHEPTGEEGLPKIRDGVLNSDALVRQGATHVGNDHYQRAHSSSTATSLDDSLQRSIVEEEDRLILPDRANNGGVLDSTGDTGISKIVDEFVSAKMSVSSSSSPPQFNQDLLHRRQTLERELLQLPIEQEISPFYDSESSSETIYSNLSDSSESPPHSPGQGLQRFRFEHTFGGAETPSTNSDSEGKFLQSHAADPVHSREVGNGSNSEGPAMDNERENIPKLEGVQVASSNEQTIGQAGVEDAKQDKNGRSDQGRYRAKPKPHRRIVNLDSTRPPHSGGHVDLESASTSTFPRTDRNISTHIQRSRSLGRLTDPEQVLRRSRTSSGHLSSPFDSMGSQDLRTSVSFHKGESREVSDGSLQFHKAHHVVGQCA